MSCNIRRRSVVVLLALAATLLSVTPAGAATKRLDFGAGTTHWEDGANWNADGVPAAADTAEVNAVAAGNTLDVSSTQTVTDLQVSNKASSGTYVAGTSTLNVLPGAAITVTSTSGMRVGRAPTSGDAVGSSTGVVRQTGGSVLVPNGTNGLRLSAEGGVVADSLYEISGGTVSGGPTNPMTSPLQVGAITSQFGVAEFHVIGSNVTQARFEDVRIAGSTANSGIARLHFTLDNNGVTPLVAEDELRFVGTGNNQLVVDLNGTPPLSDITLITADRLTTASSAPAETFTNLPNNSPMSASFGGLTYNWLLKYQDGSDDGVLDAFVKLQFVSVSAVPEASAFLMVGLIGVGGIGYHRLRRRRVVENPQAA